MNAFIPRRSPMVRISLQYVWLLSEQLEGFSRLGFSEGDTVLDLVVQTSAGDYALRGLLQGSVFSPQLRSSRPSGIELLRLLEGFSGRENWNTPIHPWEVQSIKNAYAPFKIALLAELATLPSYFVTQKGSHDTLTLLDQPSLMFPDDLQTKVPEAMFDVSEAGKAICYELATACGFHVFRATESVLRRYYTHVTGGKAQPKVRNIAVYVNAMRQNKVGNEKILGVVKQMSDLHRNPLIHPEAVLTMNEAIATIGIAHSAITAMLAELPTVPKTTASVALATAPAGDVTA